MISLPTKPYLSRRQIRMAVTFSAKGDIFMRNLMATTLIGATAAPARPMAEI